MTTVDLAALVELYRAGVDAELVMLRRLESIADRQRSMSQSQDLDAFNRASDEREQLMASLVAIEEQLSEVRSILSQMREEARKIPGFEEVLALRRSAAALVARILETDGESLKALAAAEIARRAAAKALDHGEATLAAYRKALTPPPAANLINRRG